MKSAVRYYSRSGNTELVAEAITEAAEQGIETAAESLYFRGKPNGRQLKQAEAFSKQFLR